MTAVAMVPYIMAFAGVLARIFWAFMTLFKMSFSAIAPRRLTLMTVAPPILSLVGRKFSARGANVGPKGPSIDSSVTDDGVRAFFQTSLRVFLVFSTYSRSLVW